MESNSQPAASSTNSQPKPMGVFPFYLEKAAKAGLVRRFLLQFFPWRFLENMEFEFRNAWLRLLAPLRSLQYRGKKELLVQVGCGPHGREGWVNMDCFPGKKVNCLYDIRKNLPFDDGSVRGIYSEHVVEHLDYTEEIPIFLAECYRCLAPGGILRIIVPDAGRYLKAYAAGGWTDFVPLRPLVDGADRWFKHKYHTPMELVNAVFRQGPEHHFAYDAETLEFVLRHAGFEKVTQQSYGQSADPVMCLDLADRASESLYMEAIR